MGISTREAEHIHQLAQAAGIADETLEDWTEAEGGYRYAITGHRGSIPAKGAHALRQRIKEHTAAATAEDTGPAPAPREPLATARQVEYILDLLAQRERNGDGGGFMDGPTDRAGIAALTRRKASLYITSLKEDY